MFGTRYWKFVVMFADNNIISPAHKLPKEYLTFVT